MNKEKMIELVAGQLKAYNNRDIEKFCTFFHQDVQVWSRKDGEPVKTCDNMETFRKLYQLRFDNNPDLHCELRSRVVLNDSVLDEEWVSGVSGQEAPSHLVAIYAFRDDLIGYVWFTR